MNFLPLAVITLALGIGANTVIFNLINAALLQADAGQGAGATRRRLSDDEGT